MYQGGNKVNEIDHGKINFLGFLFPFLRSKLVSAIRGGVFLKLFQKYDLAPTFWPCEPVLGTLLGRYQWQQSKVFQQSNEARGGNNSH